ncbi:2-oxo acid dehydrogenase subunit E2 [Natronobacterium gregoryi]|uniref:Dihydrolipoamide S-acyltransferase n=2 Tax=Natronobacterium gregoryi TaxID=44930 RepID=L0ALN7_NATGS|nr:2-oxo acid dehydrogenase subunit E2 [Natronobacterium gregoryi]AFZ74369.1 pyruvate/2-oxoglutarate dehydrogenase complex, dihydrolipoamide acyltransferase component [Natronobacterium gregoryi SP2]ELY63335.1 dihydrolipoamide S-acyltransferase [Natronobacterium gregoryi SP2]PLK22122.1 dihydrolipoyllysine acetyltransferase [Natronobacterium gregoryi SP2]SFI54618.1 pyruvate dehydrogenase E2 component (dihydrolipoamide acetyltransferase) [Natronobacterium gregoryi]
MGYIVRMPKLGLEMERGVLLEWHVGEGETVEEGALVAEVESEKSVGEVEAREDGVLRRTYLEEGKEVPPGTPIGIVAPTDDEIDDLEAEAEADLDGEETDAEETTAAEPTTESADAAGGSAETGAATDDVRASPRARERAQELGVDLETVEGSGYQGAITEADVEAATDTDADPEAGEIQASPRARKRADELGVNLATVEGSGYQGAITEADVEAAAADAGEATAGADDRTLAEERSFDGMRRTIATRLSESYREAVHVTVHREADVEELFDAVDAADAALEADVSIQDLLLLAVSETLEAHPEFNATFEDDVHRLWEEHNVGLAVDVEQGLITPVVRDVGSKSLSDLSDERRRLVDDALRGEYTMDDLRGGTFTVTNLGVLGSESFDPIINPPQIAILGVNAVEEQPVRSERDDVDWHRHLPLDLSFDHRVVDGADAARFLETLVDTLENPWQLLPEPVDDSARDRAGKTEMPGRTVTATTADGMAGRIEAGSFEWQYDEPEDSGGTETGPTPVDVFLGGLASCLSLSTRYQAEKRDTDVGTISVTTDADPEHGAVESIEATIHLETDADDDDVERLVELGERGCHVSQLLRADLELELSWDRR